MKVLPVVEVKTGETPDGRTYRVVWRFEDEAQAREWAERHRAALASARRDEVSAGS